MNKWMHVLTIGLFFIGTNAYANWVCNVTDKKEQQYTFSAPQEDDAENIAASVCKTFGIKSKDCMPDCYDTGVKASRWHCVVSNQAKDSWSFVTPEKDQGIKLIHKVCANHQISKKDCKPVCVPE